MAKKLTVRYDKIGDILYIDTCTPYTEQDSEELGDEIIARLNPISNTVENLEILFFSKRWDTLNLLELPINAVLQLAS
ncbi:DUF2283 domain-containing protein [Leptolyngbyaceae cyanobacterium UHCC 1019]